MKKFCICLLFLICLSPVLSSDQEQIKRLKLDYSLSEKTLYEQLQNYIPKLPKTEFAQWLKEERFESKIIDGQKYYFNRAPQNLFFVYPNLNKRNIKYKNQKEVYKALLEHIREIKKQKILIKKFAVKMQIKFLPNAPKGLIKAWLPMPANYDLIASSHKIKFKTLNKDYLQAAYLEAESPTEIWLKYNYQNAGVYFEKVLDEKLESKFVQENPPHIVFTPEIKALSEQILKNTNNITNLEKAQKFYNWISENVHYSFAPEYSTVNNLSQTCLNNLYGDCGQAAFLFITLCRLNNIPARWQSGVWHFPNKQTIHDWAAIYIEPPSDVAYLSTLSGVAYLSAPSGVAYLSKEHYGWLPVDPYMGMQAMQYSELPIQEKLELRDFYFGGIDAYRLLVNSDNNVALKPSKCSIRSDEVDFQRGEFETNCQNIYFDQFKYNYSFEEII